MFRAWDAIRFPPGQSANLLRGALGTILRSGPCGPDSAYGRIFAPRASGSGPSGLHDPPRPFVFRASHLDGVTQSPQSMFSVGLNFFDLRHPEGIGDLKAAFAGFAEAGLGPGRGRAELVGAERRMVEVSLNRPEKPVSRITVQFRTPAELKSAGEPVDRPEFRVLAARIRDRLSTLSERYGEGALAMDFRGFGERASRVVMTRCDLRYREVERRSSRTGQRHPIGGFTGEAEYEGELTEFVPYLLAAAWTGVGRQTVWGKGEIGLIC